MTARAHPVPIQRPRLDRPYPDERCECHDAADAVPVWGYCPRADRIYCVFCGHVWPPKVSGPIQQPPPV